MMFLILLFVFLGLSWLVLRRRVSVRDHWRIGLAAAMAMAGVTHLVAPTPFIQHLPPWVPERELLVFATGLIEIVLGAALLTSQPWRRYAGFLLAAYLVAVFPGNIYVAIAGVEVDGQPGGVYPWVRLLFQPMFIWLSVWVTRPASRKHREGNDPMLVKRTP